MANTHITALVTMTCDDAEVFERVRESVESNPQASSIIASELALTITYTLTQDAEL